MKARGVAPGLAVAVAAALAMGLGAGDGAAADMERGRALYENHCLACHTKQIHGRKDRWPGTIADLRAVVRQWRDNERLPWGTDEIEDVVLYLNTSQYRFSR